MNRAILLLALVFALACATDVSLPFAGAPTPTPTVTGTPTPLPSPTPTNPSNGIRVWQSWDAGLQPGIPHGFIIDTRGHLAAALSLDDGTSDLSTFVTGAHPDAGQRVAPGYWAAAGNYPYVGKSAVGRGADVGETGALAPLGVSDLQASPSTGAPAVIHFLIPTNGTYSIADIRIRLVDDALCGDGTQVIYSIDNVVQDFGIVTPSTNQNGWLQVFAGPDVKPLTTADSIDFRVDPQIGNACDATEISFVISRVGS